MTRAGRSLRRSLGLAVLMGASLPVGWAQAQVAEFDEAELFVELDDTDGALGLQAVVDGEAWGWLVIRTPRWAQDLLVINTRGQLHQQRLSEFAFESDQPTFGGQSPDAFFDRFPEGHYPLMAGSFPDGPTLTGEVELTHVIPAAPSHVLVNGEPMDRDCEDETTPMVGEPVRISWDPVATRHASLGANPRSSDITIVHYRLVVELEEDGEEVALVYSLDLPGDLPIYDVTVPPEFTALGGEFSYEIVTREESGNRTALRSCFALADEWRLAGGGIRAAASRRSARPGASLGGADGGGRP